ncbi:hypothetical protein EVG20_g3080 [Dentipellis fragilis]|uniref:SAP domain-containing protein n=1 Tax=Dentipellis fragilis TaxID=205917 RepID=A0A4Y9Z6X6_9AGAM|nr:hypothetical protein EVG20_g3080 [Dentipellis fragilis]
MSTTTQILFNSPALHSLKREQLVKLCKIHSIKANGKNVELVERLKQHARTLPPSEPLSIAARSEEGEGDEKMEEDPESSADNEDSAPDSPAGFSAAMPRPSEQWEIVMDDIEEEMSSQGGTLTSMRTASSRTQVGEFGIGGSKSSSVSSSIKALATSLGLKRSNTGKSSSMLSIATSGTMPSEADDELERHSQPYSSLPEASPSALPTMDHFTLSTPDTTFAGNTSVDPDSSMAPVPGQSSRSGRPAPSNARLSTGEGLTTTIRLVSAGAPFPIVRAEPGTPQLRPLATSFDLVAGSPDGESKIPVWPMSPQAERRTNMYPSLDMLPKPTLEGPDTSMADVQGTPGGSLLPKITLGTPGKPGTRKTPQRNSIQPSNNTIDIFSPMPSSSLAPPGSIPRSQPFVFGSPLPENNVTNKAFGHAAASVLEEMNRRLSAVGGQKVGIDLLSAQPTPEASGNGSIFGSLGSRQTDRFEKAHEEHFNKMDSIANHYAARRGAPAQSKKRKSDMLGNGPTLGTKRTSAGTRVISTGVRKKMGIPGGFGEEDESDSDDNMEEDRRMSKRIRVEEGDGGKDKGKRVSLAPSPRRGGEVSEKDKKKKEKEREATRKMLEIKREKRRSSIRRVSGIAPAPGRFPARVDRLSNSDICIGKVKGATSRFGFLASAKSMVKSVWGMGGGSNAKTAKPASSIPVSKPAPAKPSEEAKAGHTRKPSIARTTSTATSGSSNAKLSTGAPTAKATASSSRARSPLPAFGSTSSKTAPPPTSRSRIVSGGSTAASRSSMATGVSTANSRLDIKSKTSNNPSSIGTKGTASTRTSSAGVSSLGTKRSMGPGTSGIPRTTSSIGTQGSKAPNSSIGRLSTSSRLFAPTASSLAKTRNSTSGLPKVDEKPGSSKASGSGAGSAALDQITNSPGSRIPRPSPTKIFSKPLSAASSPSLVPSPVRPTSLGVAASTLAGLSSPSTVPTKAPGAIPPKPKVLAARRPRISRSRGHRQGWAHSGAAAAAAGSSGTPAKATPRTRSSVGTAARRSYGGIKSGKVAGGEALMSAKKRARQSEYMRRRSRAAGGSLAPAPTPTTLFSAGDGSMSMEIDD